jgi:hypothetical protein
MRTTLALPVLLLASCASLEPVPQVVETRAVAPFDRIELQGGSDLHVQVNAPLGLSVRAPSAWARALVTEVRDGTLYIYRAEGAEPAQRSAWGGSGNVEVTVPALVELHSSGSAEARLEGFTGGDLRIELSGSGDVRARGRVERLEASLSGSGDLQLADLTAREAFVRIPGSGEAVLRAEELAEVEITGSGDVSLRGRPAVSRLVRQVPSDVR